MAKAGNTTQASERRILRKYLARYYRAKDKREILQGRLSLLRKDLPGKGGFMPPLSVPEIEAKIQQQTEAAEKSVLEIIELLELLPAESTERIILELRHIDCKPWIDPSKEATATQIALRTGQRTFKQIAAENGSDWQKQVDDICEVLKYARDTHGIDLGGVIVGQKKTDGLYDMEDGDPPPGGDAAGGAGSPAQGGADAGKDGGPDADAGGDSATAEGGTGNGDG